MVVAHLVMTKIANEEGQAMVFLLIAAGAIMAFACGLYVTSSYLVAKIQAQNAADAAAVAGAGALADCLDALVFYNWAKGLKTAATLGLSAAAKDVARSLAPDINQWGAGFAIGRTFEIGIANGAFVVPLTVPNLEVRRNLLGFYMDRSGREPEGRYMRAATTVRPDIPSWITAPFKEEFLLGVVPEAGAVADASVSGWGLGKAKFKGVLGKVQNNPEGFFRRWFRWL